MRRALAVAVVALGACAGARGPAPIAQCPGELAPLSSVPDDLRLRLRMRVDSERGQAVLELAVEKRPGELVLVAFDPLGVVAFSVIQRPEGIEVERRLPASVQPVPPLNALYDLHRARFLDGVQRRIETPGCGYRVGVVELAAAAQ